MWSSRWRLFPLLLGAILFIAGCAGSEEPAPPVETPEPEPVAVVEPAPEAEPDPAPLPEPEPTGPQAPLTGVPTDEELQRSIAVQFDNHFGARPQSGLARADVVYEILAEGRITRYMAVFHSEMPEIIGPVRSTRPYFIDAALPFDPLYVHVGGSMQGLTDVINLKMADIDALSSGGGVFWREKHKKIPHNMYTNPEVIYAEADRKGFRTTYDVDFLHFEKNPGALEEAGTTLQVVYKTPSSADPVGYVARWVYDEEEGAYVRWVNGEPHVDEIDGEPLVFENVLVQFTSHRIIDDVGRRQLGTVGTGEGFFYRDGMREPVTWEKSSRREPTRWTDVHGEPIVAKPGKTFVQIVETGREITE